ncbi:MAG: cbb3-type cytochrome oxidase assembly protein CcoS [Fulvivirga sp.]|nr:cbb3-type cytochrome oxidase assembly protein CcoS [Fulvivirga sp.]
MEVIFILILISMVVAGGFLALFIWASKSGQFDDTVTPSMRVLFEEKTKKSAKSSDKSTSKKQSD